MSDFLPAFWTALFGLITTTWPEIGLPQHPIIRSTTINRTTWNNVIDKFNAGDANAQYGPPFVVIGMGQLVEDPTWGMHNNAYRFSLGIYYVRDTQLTSQERTDDRMSAPVVETKLAQLRDQLLHFTGTEFTVDQAPTMDVTDENPANMAFLDRQVSLLGGLLTVAFLVGEQWTHSIDP